MAPTLNYDRSKTRLSLKNLDPISDMILDKGLARLGDSYLNFLYSLALSEARGEPTGVRVTDKVLIEVAKATGIKSKLPKRTPGGRVADSIEALIAYTWLKGALDFKDMMEIFRRMSYDPKSSIEEIVKVAFQRLTE